MILCQNLKIKYRENIVVVNLGKYFVVSFVNIVIEKFCVKFDALCL